MKEVLHQQIRINTEIGILTRQFVKLMNFRNILTASLETFGNKPKNTLFRNISTKSMSFCGNKIPVEDEVLLLLDARMVFGKIIS